MPPNVMLAGAAGPASIVMGVGVAAYFTARTIYWYNNGESVQKIRTAI